MLEMYCERAELYDGMHLIDLGCGWGSVTLYMAGKYPNSQITSISNSHTQREYILSTAAKRGYKNVQVFTGDIVTFDLPAETFYGQADRVISIEMFEHMKNYELLLHKVSNWLKPQGKVSKTTQKSNHSFSKSMYLRVYFGGEPYLVIYPYFHPQGSSRSL